MIEMLLISWLVLGFAVAVIRDIMRLNNIELVPEAEATAAVIIAWPLYGTYLIALWANLVLTNHFMKTLEGE